jgi:hypothetical protein
MGFRINPYPKSDKEKRWLAAREEAAGLKTNPPHRSEGTTMTWAEFKRTVEEAGIEDDSEIGHIRWNDPEEVTITPYSDGKKFAIDGDEED